MMNSSAELAATIQQQQQQAHQAAAHPHHPGTVIVAAPSSLLSSAALNQRQVTLNGASGVPGGTGTTTIEVQGAGGTEVKQVVTTATIEGAELKPGAAAGQTGTGAPTHLTMASTATGQTFLVPFSGQVSFFSVAEFSRNKTVSV